MAYTYTPIVSQNPKSPSLDLVAGPVLLTAQDVLISRFYHPSNGTNAITLPSTESIIQARNLGTGDAFNFTLRNTGSGSSILTTGDGFANFAAGSTGTVMAGSICSFTVTCTSISPPALMIDTFAVSGNSLSPYDNLSVYMSTTGNDLNDGLTPQTAVLTLQTASNRVQQYGYNYSATVNIAAGLYPVTDVTFGGPNLGLVQGPITFQGAEGVLLSNASVVGSVTDPNFQNMQTLTLQGGVTLPPLPAGFTTYQGLWIRWKSGGSSTEVVGNTYTIASGTPGGTTLNITEFNTVTTGTIDIIYPLTKLQQQGGGGTFTAGNFTFFSTVTFAFNTLQIDAVSGGTSFFGGNLGLGMVLFTLQVGSARNSFVTKSLSGGSGRSAGPSFIDAVVPGPFDRGNLFGNGTFALSNGVGLNTSLIYAQCSAIFSFYYLYSCQVLVGTASLSPPPASFADVNFNTVISDTSNGHAFHVTGGQNYAYFGFCTAVKANLTGFFLSCVSTLWFCVADHCDCEGVRGSNDCSLYVVGGTYTNNGVSVTSPFVNHGIYMTGGSCLNINSGTNCSTNQGSGILVENGSLNVNMLGGGSPATVTCSSNVKHGIQMQNGSLSMQKCTCSSNTLDGVNIQGGTANFITNMTFSSNARDGIHASNCRALMQGGTGTSNGGYGVNLVQNASFGANPSLTGGPTGTLGAVKVGVNAVATWANITGGTAAFCTDAANTSPAFCKITPINYATI